MKECVVSFGVSSGYKRPMYKRVEFEKGIDRLRDNIQDLGYDFIGFKGWPDNWPTMQFCPYGFKFYAIREAQQLGYKCILWADSSVVFSPEGIEHCFDKMKRDGYFFLGRSKEKQGIRATYFGLNLDNDDARYFFKKIFELTKTGDAFRDNSEADQAVMSTLIKKMGLKISGSNRHGIKIDQSYVKEKLCP